MADAGPEGCIPTQTDYVSCVCVCVCACMSVRVCACLCEWTACCGGMYLYVRMCKPKYTQINSSFGSPQLDSQVGTARQSTTFTPSAERRCL